MGSQNGILVVGGGISGMTSAIEIKDVSELVLEAM